jgi:hypothetical protein
MAHSTLTTKPISTPEFTEGIQAITDPQSPQKIKKEFPLIYIRRPKAF